MCKHYKIRYFITGFLLICLFALFCPLSVSAEMHLNHTELTLACGQTTQITVIEARKKSVKWSTGDKKIAEVRNGVVTAGKKPGKTVIKAVVGKKSFICQVTVVEGKLNQSKIVLCKGQAFPIKIIGVNVSPNWVSEDSKIAMVVGGGVIIGRSAGKTMVSAFVGQDMYECSVTVEAPKLSRRQIYLSPKESYKLRVIGTKQKIKWKATNPRVISVKNGVVKAKKAGLSFVSATILGKSYYCKVIVRS